MDSKAWQKVRFSFQDMDTMSSSGEFPGSAQLIVSRLFGFSSALMGEMPRSAAELESLRGYPRKPSGVSRSFLLWQGPLEVQASITRASRLFARERKSLTQGQPS